MDKKTELLILHELEQREEESQIIYTVISRDLFNFKQALEKTGFNNNEIIELLKLRLKISLDATIGKVETKNK